MQLTETRDCPQQEHFHQLPQGVVFHGESAGSGMVCWSELCTQSSLLSMLKATGPISNAQKPKQQQQQRWTQLFRSPLFSADPGSVQPRLTSNFYYTAKDDLEVCLCCGYLGECLAEQKNPPTVPLLLPMVRRHCACSSYFSDVHSAQGNHAFSKKLTGSCSCFLRGQSV